MHFKIGDVEFNCLPKGVVKDLILRVHVSHCDEIGSYGQLAHKQSHLLYMEGTLGGPVAACGVEMQPKKRFCCGAAKRLKEKCLRFHQSEDKCIEFIKGSLGLK